ncbi:hypothetical protein DID88_007523 [Monilinia fructigena]|uniref:C3H1-type domain-containing protein n=1 Tax=Monilinia fructigena TaxID=38457 RepID=A0A395J2M7_9HELO|nr:hypothetical protein DID88_007523 [Monilinia fructigena]
MGKIQVSSDGRAQQIRWLIASLNLPELIQGERPFYEEIFCFDSRWKLVLRNKPLDFKSTLLKLTTRERLRNKPLEIVVPKTEVCYFWAIGDRCRYPEALCRDLHEDREYTLQTNVRDGKPNPGPLCESRRSDSRSTLRRIARTS